MRVIYIVGMGRSGSTLLDLLLDAHSNVRSLGGVRRMTRALHGTDCACGAAPQIECEFWRDVDQQLYGELEKIDPESRDSATFRRHNVALFEAAARVAGTDFVVDSSKSVSRLRRLLTETDLDVYPIHIVRDPRGYAYSQSKRKSRRLTPAWSYVGRSLRTYGLLHGRTHAMVEYEHMVQDTKQCLRQLMARLGSAYEPTQLDWARQVHHNVGGGAVLKRTKDSTIRFDKAWRENVPPFIQAMIQLIALPGMLANKDKQRRWGLDQRT